MAEQLLEVPKIVSQDRIQQQTVEQFVDRSEAKQDDISKAEKSLAALMASQAAGKSSCTQVVSDHETSVKVFAEELKAWTEATQVLQSETSGDDRQTYSLFQENSSAALQTSTDFKGFDVRDSGQTARRAGALTYSRSAEIAHLCNHEVRCRR